MMRRREKVRRERNRESEGVRLVAYGRASKTNGEGKIRGSEESATDSTTSTGDEDSRKREGEGKS